MLRVRLLFRLNLEMHYSTWKDDVETFKSYWLHKNIVGRLQEGRILLTETGVDTAISSTHCTKCQAPKMFLMN
jgi:hypothetical protein